MPNTHAYTEQAASAPGAPPHASVSHADTGDVQQRPQKCRFRLVRTIAGLSLFALSLGTANRTEAQAKYTATRSADWQVGGGFTLGLPDYSEQKFKGGMFYTTYDFKPHFGVELNFHQINDSAPSKLYERTYEVGGRYVRHYGIYHPYAKLIYGRGVFNYQFDAANLAYNIGAVGAGLDINVARRINVRADYEYQKWFGFRGFVTGINDTNTTTLAPQLFTIGAAYHFR